MLCTILSISFKKDINRLITKHDNKKNGGTTWGAVPPRGVQDKLISLRKYIHNFNILHILL